VWREGNTSQLGHWDGPFPLLSIERETCIVELSSGATSFRSTVVKPYLQLESSEIRESSQLESGTKESLEINLKTGDSDTIEVEIPTP
jgi:hypothetical protein